MSVQIVQGFNTTGQTETRGSVIQVMTEIVHNRTVCVRGGWFESVNKGGGHTDEEKYTHSN